jgi:hypothetical protein
VPIHDLGDIRSNNARLFFAIKGAIAEVPSILQIWMPQMDVVGGLAALAGGIPWLSWSGRRVSSTWNPIVARLRSLALAWAICIRGGR